jgi:hypothetical protein
MVGAVESDALGGDHHHPLQGGMNCDKHVGASLKLALEQLRAWDEIL